MGKHSETELKLQVMEAKDWPGILKCPAIASLSRPGSGNRTYLEARYYDTIDGRLRKAGFAYRIRREDTEWVATVKGGGGSGGGLHQRLEYNVTVPEPVPDLTVFQSLPVGQILCQAAGAQPLGTILTTCFERQTVLLAVSGSSIELAADRGEIIAAEKRVPILEIELELKTGQPAVLLSTGAKLAEGVFLLPEPRSKFARGLELAGISTQIAPPTAPSLVVRHVQQLLAYHSQPDGPPSGWLAGLQGLRQLTADLADYRQFNAALADWSEQLRQGQSADYKKTVPLLLNIWAAAIDGKGCTYTG